MTAASAAPATPRVVLDTNVCLDLLVFASARSATLLDHLQRGTLQAVTRADCRDEWRRVLGYPELKLDAERRVAFVHAYDAMMLDVPAATHATTRIPRCRDRDDQKFLELARDAGAVALFTRDAELLVLSRRAQRDAGFVIVAPVDIGAVIAGAFA